MKRGMSALSITTQRLSMVRDIPANTAVPANSRYSANTKGLTPEFSATFPNTCYTAHHNKPDD